MYLLILIRVCIQIIQQIIFLVDDRRSGSGNILGVDQQTGQNIFICFCTACRDRFDYTDIRFVHGHCHCRSVFCCYRSLFRGLLDSYVISVQLCDDCIAVLRLLQQVIVVIICFCSGAFLFFCLYDLRRPEAADGTIARIQRDRFSVFRHQLINHILCVELNDFPLRQVLPAGKLRIRPLTPDFFAVRSGLERSVRIEAVIIEDLLFAGLCLVDRT